MKTENGEVISEIWPEGTPANYGNAMAETGRYSHMASSLGLKDVYNTSLLRFRTGDNYIQSSSPNCPVSWLVGTDQCLPWFLAAQYRMLPLHDEMRNRIKSWGWKTPDGNYVSPIFLAFLINSKVLLNVCLFIQALVLKYSPIRWSDKTRWFESTANSTADYLNWSQAAKYASPFVRNMIDKDELYGKIELYYKPTDGGPQEPNVDGLLGYYRLYINEYWR